MQFTLRSLDTWSKMELWHFYPNYVVYSNVVHPKYWKAVSTKFIEQNQAVQFFYSRPSTFHRIAGQDCYTWLVACRVGSGFSSWLNWGPRPQVPGLRGNTIPISCPSSFPSCWCLPCTGDWCPLTPRYWTSRDPAARNHEETGVHGKRWMRWPTLN